MANRVYPDQMAFEEAILSTSFARQHKFSFSKEGLMVDLLRILFVNEKSTKLSLLQF